MIHVLWEFVVKKGAVKRFEQAYGPAGAWARLFRGHPGYRGTALLRDEDNPRRYVTIDVWDTGDSRERMLTQVGARYSDLDEVLADLTESEDEIGTFRAATELTAYRLPQQRRGRARPTQPGSR